ncbi:hypothetical protein N3K66_006601 [Trichothecium roseum]|uniref:Uncharacterized protein n=1 Tax=Trichothecium roseum TaxID=47278 RepID=A0ACC0UVV6_9HYPO|nr:hypothetical protein N3K66_006601 [Trichothecium roseum]
MAPKRKLPSVGLERRVRARKEEEPEPEAEVSSEGEENDDDDDSDSHDFVSEQGVGRRRKGQDDSDGEDDGGSQSGSEDDEEEEGPAGKADLSNISFGALARAQASLPALSKRKSKSGVRPGDDDNDNDDSEEGDDDRRGRGPGRQTQKTSKYNHAQRSSKHAPQEVSSKRPVARGRRDIVARDEDPARRGRGEARDPRFDPAVSSGNSRAVQEIKARKAYAFLDEYRESEMAALRQEAKKTRDPAAKEALKRKLMSMESRKRARERKDEGERLLAEHRRAEKGAVAQGKRPFYLKKSEQKKQLLLNRFQGMSGAQVDKAIERKRKKVAGKEKKELGSLERVTSRRG